MAHYADFVLEGTRFAAGPSPADPAAVGLAVMRGHAVTTFRRAGTATRARCRGARTPAGPDRAAGCWPRLACCE
jgi:hypothetical protein